MELGRVLRAGELHRRHQSLAAALAGTEEIFERHRPA